MERDFLLLVRRIQKVPHGRLLAMKKPDVVGTETRASNSLASRLVSQIRNHQVQIVRRMSHNSHDPVANAATRDRGTELIEPNELPVVTRILYVTVVVLILLFVL